MMMNFKKVAGAGIAAVTFSLMAGTAMAGTFANTPTTYATQGIPASGLVTISATPLYTSTAATGTGSYLITYTLPTGVTFATSPSITTSGTGTSTAVLAGGGSGSNTATFTVNVTAVGTTILTLGSFQITGATALSTPKASGTFNMTEQVSGSTVAGIPNEATASSAPLAISASQISIAAAAPGTVSSVDIKSPSNGTKFLPLAGADTTVGDIGNTTVAFGTGLNSSATAAYTFTSPSYVETFTGNTTGISTAYLAAAGTTTCAATPAAQGAITGSIAGVISGSTITFSGLPVATPGARELCLYTAGTALLGTNPNGFAVSAAIDTTTAPLAVTTPLAYTYNGVALGFNYAVNTSSSYASYIRIINPTTAPLVVTALVTSDAGATGTATVEAGLAAGNNDLVSMSTITSAAGVVSQSGRYTITLFASGTAPATGAFFESLLVNPGGVVSQIN